MDNKNIALLSLRNLGCAHTPRSGNIPQPKATPLVKTAKKIRAESPTYNMLSLQDANTYATNNPKALPWAGIYCHFVAL